MGNDTTIREQGYQYFLREAPELLQVIEQELLTLREDYSLVKVHSLMRTTHTLKGSAANVGLETIKTISHHLEDVFKALYNPDLVIDNELETLLFQGYECLRLPLMAEITGGYVNDTEVMDRTVATFAQLQAKLGDYFARETPIPTSIELGFDITKSIFEIGVKQRLESLASALNNSKAWELEASLREQAEIFVGLAESLNLPGFGAIAQKTLAALELHPQQSANITKVALTDFWQAWNAVMAGDRDRGGEPSFTLQQLAGVILPPAAVSEEADFSLVDFGSAETIENSELLEDVEAIASVNDAVGVTQTELELAEIGENLEFPENESVSLPLKAEQTTDFVFPVDFELEINGDRTTESPSLDDVFGNFVTVSDEQKLENNSLDLNNLEPEIVEATWVEVDRETPPDRSDSQQMESPKDYRAREPIPATLRNPGTETSTPGIKVPRPSVRVDLELLERLSHLVGELLIYQNRQANISEQLQEAIGQIRFRLRRHQQTMSQLRDLSDQTLINQDRQNAKFPNSDFKSPFNLKFEISNLQLNQFDALELDRYSEFHVLLQVVLEEMIQLEEATDSTDLLARQSNQILEKQRRLLNNVQDDMREARMLPLGDIFTRFFRLLQQLSTTHQKTVELTLRGTDVLVDRALAEKLYDPILHLVRNAFDHGIELPEIRSRRGKPETGNIEIRAYHRGDRTIIEVSDDGWGIECDRIRNRAVELGWLSAEQANSLSEAGLFDLLFEPGFSTATQISELSGRGIGLNVVRSQMQALSGSVTVYSEPGRGTTFLLQFPMTLTMAKLMICEAGGAVYALLSDAIEQILIPKSDQIQQLEGQKVLHLNRGAGGIIPVYNMTQLLEKPSSSHSLAPSPLLLLRRNAELVGLEVDQIVGEQELVIRPLGKAIAPPTYVYGGSTLADGRLTLVIDGAALVDRLLNQLTAKPIDRKDFTFNPPLNPPLLPQERSTEHQPSSKTSLPKILVVDDSISLRQTLALTLQKAAYQVVQAQNGREALQQLQQNTGIGLVLCDIEMPSMNGFEFLNHCRHDPNLAKLPVVMLTSRTGEKHRTIALELGAMGYLTKPYREDEVLGAVSNLLN